MAIVSDILAGKGMHLVNVSAQASVLQAAILMNEKKIGSVLVLDEGRLVGILTERDILVRVVAAQRDVNATTVAEVMTRDLVCARPTTDLEEARGTMMTRRIRHLPVVADEGGIVGIVSIGDLNAHQVHQQERTIHQLQGYINGTW